MPINPEMLVVARESRGLTQTSLAESWGVTQSKVSKIESGLSELQESELPKVSRILDYPVEFFHLGDRLYGLTGYFCFRKRASLSITEQKLIQAHANVLRIRVTRLLRGVSIETPYEFPRLDVDDIPGGVVEIARRVRAAWSLPSGPVRNVMKAIEGAGGMVFLRPFGTKKLDAVVQCPLGLPPIILLNSFVTAGERQRFSLAHEIGHVVMRNFYSADPEREANRFASEFLMPEYEIAPDLDDFTFAKALRLKPYWRVSAQALIMRAYQLGKIDERRYKYLFSELCARGYRLNEPIPLAVEQPSLVQDVVESHINSMGFDNKNMCKLLVSNESDYNAQFKFNEAWRQGFGIVTDTA